MRRPSLLLPPSGLHGYRLELSFAQEVASSPAARAFSIWKNRMQPRKFIKYVQNPFLLFWRLGLDGHFQFIPDRLYLQLCFRIRMGHWPNLDSPRTFSEKLQWLKLYDRRPDYTRLADKLAVRDHVEKTIGAQHLIPLLGVWDTAEEIDFDALPDRFVLKCTHDSDSAVLCPDKAQLDVEKARASLARHLAKNYYGASREWSYRDIPPRVIAEQFMVDESGRELKDYKFFCFDGEPRALFIASDRASKTEETKFDFFDMDFRLLPFTNGHPNSGRPIPRPKTFEEMKALARTLSRGWPHVRVDLYDVNGQIYFGELTFAHWGGLTPFVPEEWDAHFGRWLRLPPPYVPAP